MTLSSGRNENTPRGGPCMGLSGGKYVGKGLTGGRLPIGGGGVPNETLGAGVAVGGEAGFGGGGSLAAMMSHLSSSSKCKGLGLDLVVDAI